MNKTEILSQDDLLINCERSARYHQERMRFCDRLNQSFQIIVLAASTVGIFGLLNELLGARAMSGLMAVIGVLTLFLVINRPAEKIGLHDFLRRNFNALEGEIISAPNPGKAALAKWTGRLYALYADEPPVHRALSVICANQTAIARGDDQRLRVDLRWHQRWFCNMYTFPNAKFLNRYQQQEQRAQVAGQKSAAQPA